MSDSAFTTHRASSPMRTTRCVMSRRQEKEPWQPAAEAVEMQLVCPQEEGGSKQCSQ